MDTAVFPSCSEASGRWCSSPCRCPCCSSALPGPVRLPWARPPIPTTPTQGPGGGSLLRSHLGAHRSPPGSLSRGPQVVTPLGTRPPGPVLARARPRRAGAVPGVAPAFWPQLCGRLLGGGQEGAALLALRAVLVVCGQQLDTLTGTGRSH